MYSLREDSAHDPDASVPHLSSFAGTQASAYDIVHIPHHQLVAAGKIMDCVHCCYRTGIDSISTTPATLTETLVRSRRSSQQDRYIWQTVAQQSEQFLHLPVMHIRIVLPVMTFIRSKRKNQQLGFQGCNSRNTVRMSKRQASSSIDSPYPYRTPLQMFLSAGHR